MHKFSALPEGKCKDIPFPLSLTMEIKPNVELFVEFESYLNWLFEESKTDLEMRENINDIARLKNYYTTDALNLYNLVPCCTRCNTTLKGKKETDFRSYASPYSDDLYCSFKVRAYHNMNDVGRVVGGDTSRLQVKYIPLECDTNRRVAHLMLKLFKWEDVYNGIFSEEVKDIFRKTRLLTPAFKMWMKDMKLIGANSDRLLYGCSMRRSEVCRYRFAKVIQDFAERYGGVKIKD